MLQAVIITFIAGLSTVVGCLPIYFIKKPSENIVSAAMGFAGGVMLTVSLTDMLPTVFEEYSMYYQKSKAVFFTISLFIIGCIIAILITKLLPSTENLILQNQKINPNTIKATRSALITLMVLTAHNLPEGIITLFTSYALPELGVTLAIAIALHNIPEGIAISMPIYYATNSKTKAFLATFISGICEPLGAILTFFVLKNFISNLFLTGLISLIAGIMACVSLVELLPVGFTCAKKTKYCTIGAVFGMFIMLASIFII